MSRFTVRLLPPVEEQLKRGGGSVIDPAGVRVNLGHEIPVFPDFDHQGPPVGRVTNVRVDEDGSLVGDVEAFETFPLSMADIERGLPHVYAVGGTIERQEEDEVRTVSDLRLLEVGVLPGDGE